MMVFHGDAIRPWQEVITSCGTGCENACAPGCIMNLAHSVWTHPRSNVITALPPGVFDHLTQLQDLFLDVNEITALPTGVFDQLTQLRTLRLGGNKITTLPTGVFDHLTQLRTLDMRFNEITELPAEVFDHL